MGGDYWLPPAEIGLERQDREDVLFLCRAKADGADTHAADLVRSPAYAGLPPSKPAEGLLPKEGRLQFETNHWCRPQSEL
jgi:hypothetical protein